MIAAEITKDRRDSAMQHVRGLEFRKDTDGRDYSFEQIASYYRSQYTWDEIQAYWNTLPNAPFNIEYFLSSSDSYRPVLDQLGKEQLWLEVKRDARIKQQLLTDQESAIWAALTAEPPGSGSWLLSLLADLEIPIEDAICCALERWGERCLRRGTSLASFSNIDTAYLAKKAPGVLWKAAQCNMQMTARFMLVARTDPDVRWGPNRRTPLMLAASGGHIYIASLLVDYGANLQLRDVHGKTPAQLIGSRRTSKQFKLIMLRSILPCNVRQGLQRLTQKAHECSYRWRERLYLRLSYYRYYRWRIRQFMRRRFARYRFDNLGLLLMTCDVTMIMVCIASVLKLFARVLRAALW